MRFCLQAGTSARASDLRTLDRYLPKHVLPMGRHEMLYIHPCLASGTEHLWAPPPTNLELINRIMEPRTSVS